jgi:hypothetical protein
MLAIETRMKNFAIGAVSDLESYAGITLTVDEMIKMIYESDRLNFFIDEVKEFDYDEPADGLDTCIRDSVFDLVANVATGRDWPLNMEIDSKEFFENLEEWKSEKSIDMTSKT